jgi:hypothetical protein
MAKDKAIVLATQEYEFTTESVVRIGEDYFFRDENGGERGAWQDRANKTTPLSRSEARARLLEMGMEPDDVAEKTA